MSGQEPATPSERRIDYVEFASRDPSASRRFFEQVFGWRFQDYGPGYTAFDNAGRQGGFFRAEPATAAAGAPLEQVRAHGGEMVKPVFAFPGGRRFQFIEPGGNELAVCSERDSD